MSPGNVREATQKQNKTKQKNHTSHDFQTQVLSAGIYFRLHIQHPQPRVQPECSLREKNLRKRPQHSLLLVKLIS